jgi:subtilisin family serine protease
MGRLTVLALTAALAVAICASPATAATERVGLARIDRELPPSLAVSFDLPPSYAVDAGTGDENSGSWTGPPYASEAGGLGSTSNLDWDVTIEQGAALAAVPRASLVHSWPVIAEGTLPVPRLVRGRDAGSIAAPWVLTLTPGSEGRAQYEAALALPLAPGRAILVRLSALTPSHDVAGGGFGRFFVQGPAGPVAPSVWNRAQIEAVLASVRLEGSLPPRAISLERLGDVVRAVLGDVTGEPVAGQRVRAEVRRGGAWRPLRAAVTGADGSLELDLAAAGGGRRVRLVAGSGNAVVRSRPLSVPASDGDPYIVVLKDGAGGPAGLARAHSRRLGLASPRAVFDSALRGYATDLSPAQRRALAADPAVRGIVPDRLLEIPELAEPLAPGALVVQPPQEVPLGVRRIGATESPTARIDGVDDRVPVDVAVIDTGIAPHPDLNVVGGKNCGDGPDSAYAVADNGHGTHVAGIIGAKDNAFGVVGVAPGARIWSVRALGETGAGRWSWVICALDFVADRSPAKGGPIKVANLSLGAPAGTLPCDHPDAWVEPVHLAVCRAVKRGVTVVASAGNAAQDLKRFIPATYPETIVVPALADYDGRAGGLARGDPVTTGAACRQLDGDALSVTESFYGPQGTAYEADDDLLVVFNWPSSDEPHALAAPGACIRSTWPGRSYRKESGTSMASPHVAGAAGLYLATHPSASPAQVLAALRQAGEREIESQPGPVTPGALIPNHFDTHDRHGEPVVRARAL